MKPERPSTTVERLQAELRQAVELERKAYAEARAATAVVESLKLAIIDAENEDDVRRAHGDR